MESSAATSRVRSLPQICEVVLCVPRLAAIGRSLAELANFVSALIEELKMSTQLGSVGLGYVIGPVIHHPVFQSAIEMDHAAHVVDPELLPSLKARVVDVVALAGVAPAQAGPIFPDHTISEFLFDMAGSLRRT